MTGGRFYFFTEPICSSGICHSVVAGCRSGDPVIPLGSPGSWDCHRVQVFGSVLHDETESTFRMWYLGLGEEPELDSARRQAGMFFNNCRQGYAESPDGEHWHKPSLGQVEYKGSTENNILRIPPACPGAPYVIEDPEQGDCPHRFKMILTQGSGGALLFSQDGTDWRPYDNAAVLFHGGKDRGDPPGFDYYCHEPYAFLKDELTKDPAKRYRVYTQASSGKEGGWVRRTGLIYSADARNWTVHPGPVMGLPMCARRVISGQVHGTAMMIYKGYYLAFIHFCLPHPETGWLAPRVHLAVSRDGEHFHVFEDVDDALIPIDPAEAWSAGGLVAGSVLTAGDEIRCYYSGLPVTACWAGQPEADEHQIISTGLARWRRDRILSISLSRGFSEGCLMLDPLPVEGGRGVQAVLNADGDEAQGGVRLALLDPGSRAALPGFSFDDCEVRRIDASTVEGRWQGSAMPAGVASAVPCVQLRDASARLYSVEYSQTHGGKVPGAMRRVGSVIPGEPRATRETDRVARGAATKCQALSMAASG